MAKKTNEEEEKTHRTMTHKFPVHLIKIVEHYQVTRNLKTFSGALWQIIENYPGIVQTNVAQKKKIETLETQNMQYREGAENLKNGLKMLDVLPRKNT